jgi:5,10-methylenetetrahydrofolate reductase
MIDPALAQRFEQMTGVECPEHLHELFRCSSVDLDWRQIEIALGNDIADQLRELNELRGFRPIGETIEQILKRIGVQ